jgi:hypothetical protein
VKTAVFQSYRTREVPGWLELCMGSVRAWASQRGYDYRFIDDRFFDYAPDWYRQKAGNQVLLVADLARLLVARELLGSFDRVIWLDADVLVFDPARLLVEVPPRYAFCAETWVFPDPQGNVTLAHNVNNAVCVFCRGNAFLDFYIDAAQRIVANKEPLAHTDASTNFLTALARLMPLPQITNVGLFSPPVMADLAGAGDRFLGALLDAVPSGYAAANLCASLRGLTMFGIEMTDDLYGRVVGRLQEKQLTGGRKASRTR